MTLIADIYDKFITAKAEGQSEAVECYVEVMSHPVVRKERDQYRLFSTDIGKCPRAISYRMRGVAKDPRSAEQERNDRAMFEVAEHIESNLVAAFMWHGQLFDHQFSIPFSAYGRENWGGRGDLLVWLDGQVRIVEVKTHRGNASNYDLPKHPHMMQARSYDLHPPVDAELTAPGILWYKSRDGSGDPWEFPVIAPATEVNGLMDELEAVREDAKADRELPTRRLKVLKLTSYGKKVELQPHWECKPGWCNFHETCKPDTGKSCWAELNGTLWNVKRAADVDALAAWGADEAAKMLHPITENSMVTA